MKPIKRGVKDTEEERAHVPNRRSWGGLQCWAGAANNPPLWEAGQGLHMGTPMSSDRALKAPGEAVWPVYPAASI